MRISTHLRAQILASAVLLASTSGAMAYTIDGDIHDWGLNHTGQDSDWTPNSGVSYAVSDQNNNELSGGYVYNFTQLGALGYGDQPYDAEAIYLDFDSTYMYFMVITGRPENVSQYPAGDIAIDFGSNGSWEYGIETRGNNGYAKGDLVAVSNWALGNPYAAAGVTEIQGGTVVSDTGDGNALVYGNKITDIGRYTSDSDDDHYAIEGRVALADFALYAGQSFTIHWTMGCGNDEIHLSGTMPTPPGGGGEVPVPGTGLLLGGTLVGWVIQRRRQIAKPVTDEQDDAQQA
ncbi:MAG: hypothetical protein H6926_03335 [Chromatiales bacterium]|nr:hypothetical protein [Gammaproteobacteria bacterium]MCP5352208.1 hypothetical protein [Chromatiales bacterium]